MPGLLLSFGELMKLGMGNSVFAGGGCVPASITGSVTSSIAGVGLTRSLGSSPGVGWCGGRLLPSVGRLRLYFAILKSGELLLDQFRLELS